MSQAAWRVADPLASQDGADSPLGRSQSHGSRIGKMTEPICRPYPSGFDRQYSTTKKKGQNGRFANQATAAHCQDDKHTNQVCDLPALNADFADSHARIHLPAAGFAAHVFAAAEFLDDELLALLGAEHFGGDAGAFTSGRPSFVSPSPPTASTLSNLIFSPG